MKEHRAREGVEHLQQAALEVIHAMRAFLDVAEEVVRDPGGALAVAESLAETAKRAAAASAGLGNLDDDAAGESGVTRIRVS